MKDFLKRIRADYLFSSLLLIALGVIFIIYNDGVLDILGSVFAIILLVIGVIYICSFFLNLLTNGFSVVLGIIVLAIGIWFLINPNIIVSLIPILLGIVLLFHGIRGLIESLSAKKYGFGSWTIGIILEIISIVFGILCIVDAFGMMEKATIVVGIILIYNGFSNMWIASRVSKYEKVYNANNTIDVDFIDNDNQK